MTDDKLNLILARYFEPKPSVSPGELDSNLSPLGFWILHEKIAGEWQPRNMVTDPAMTVMLKQEIRKSARLSITIERANPEYKGLQHEFSVQVTLTPYPYDHKTIVRLDGSDENRLVAEAFSKWKGIQ